MSPNDDSKRVAIEDEVLSRLTTIYHGLEEVSRMVADEKELLRRCGSPLADESTGCPAVVEARAIVEEIARCIHAFRIVEFPAGDDSDEAFIEYMERIDRAKRQWRP
jgi:hypothetical protein